MNAFKPFIAEFLGASGLLIVVVGSGIMGETLAQGNQAVALLANSIATGAGLFVLIHLFRDISGAHFNPVVSFIELLRGQMRLRMFTLYGLAQIAGALSGAILTHVMFGMQLLQQSTHDRSDFRFVFSEVLATFGLILVISLIKKPEILPTAVSLFITAAYWCTSSTSFANPAVTIARSFTNTFSGIEPSGVLGFIGAQFTGAVLAHLVSRLFLRPQPNP